MINFIEAIKNVLDERGESVKVLFNNNVISKDTFYKYRKRNPSLQTTIKIANYLDVSIDYIYELSDTNSFLPYSTNQQGFYNNLVTIIKSNNMSFREFCKKLGVSPANVSRYKNGVEPNVTTLLDIARLLNCTIDDLLIRIKK